MQQRCYQIGIDGGDDDVPHFAADLFEDADLLHAATLFLIILCRAHVVHRRNFVSVNQEQV